MIKNYKKPSLKIALISMLLLSLIGCTTLFSPQTNEENNTDVTTKVEDVVLQDLPPQELITNNLKETDVSVAYIITSADLDFSDDLYATYKLVGTITQVYKGAYKLDDTIEFYKTIEVDNVKDIKTPFIDQTYVASFNIVNDQLQIPDVAYDFSYTDKLGELYINALK